MMEGGMMGGAMALGMGAWTLLIGLAIILFVLALLRISKRRNASSHDPAQADEVRQ